MTLPSKVGLSTAALVAIAGALVITVRFLNGAAATSTIASTTVGGSPVNLLEQINAGGKTSTTVTVEAENGVKTKQVTSPDEELSGLLLPTLAIDQILVCDAYGVCSVETVPLSSEEQAVVNGTSSTGISVRGVYNADDPAGPVQQFDKIYGRAIVSPTASGERWYKNLDFGRSWDALVETSITRGTQNCNSIVTTSNLPARIVATMDNTTCDGDGVPIVIRWAAMVAENDIQNCPGNPKAAICRAVAPITVLPSRRQGYMVFYGDELKKVYQAQVPLGQPLP